MKQRNWGRIVFISSESGIQIPDNMIHYGMTKTAQLAISRGLAETCVGTNVTVNAVLPGPTLSDGNKAGIAKRVCGQALSGIRKRVLRESPPKLAAEALRHGGGSRQHGRLCLQPAFVRHQRRGAARGRRRRTRLLLSAQATGTAIFRNGGSDE